MPRQLTPTIAAEVAKSNLAAIDLIEVDFGARVKRYWSTLNVPAKYIFSDFPISHFEPRIISLGGRRLSLGPDNDSLNLTLAEHIDGFEKLSDFIKQYGLDIFEGALVCNHRLFPNINMTFKDVWFGKGLALEAAEGSYTWPIEFGFGNFRQTFGRRLQTQCPHVFASGPRSDCPYDPSKLIGIPEAEFVFSAGAGTSNTTIRGSGFLNRVKKDWIVFNRDTNAFATVTSVVSNDELKISRIGAGEGGRSHFRPGNKVIVGPKFTSCPSKTTSSCKERGMFGYWNRETQNNGIGDNKRYYGGNSAAARVVFFGRVPGKDGDRFSRSRLGNESVDGSVIPVVFGFYRIRDIPSTYHAPAGDFQHGLFYLCEGMIYDVRNPLVNSKEKDDNPPSDLNTLKQIIKHDSFIKYGTWRGSSYTQFGSILGADSRAKTVDDAYRIRRGIGGRTAFAMTSNRALDTYGVDEIGNPYLFNNARGDGVALSGLVATRIRIETNQDVHTALAGDFDISGLLVPLLASMPNNSEDGVSLNLQGLKFTRVPNPIQVAYALAIDTRWGGGLPPIRILESSVLTESAFCEEPVTSTVSENVSLKGSIGASSADALGSPAVSFIFSPDVIADTNSLTGRKILVNPGTPKASVATIEGNIHFGVGGFKNIQPQLPGVSRIPSGLLEASPRGSLLFLDRILGTIPNPDDEIVIPISNSASTKRFKANGALADDISVGEMLQLVLDNCFGTFRMNGTKVEFLIRKKLSARQLANIVSDGVFTDRGSSPNIIRNSNGESSVKVTRESITDIPNEFTSEFADIDRDFATSRVVIFNERAQIRAAEKYGEHGSRKIVRQRIDLNLTTHKDQSARVLTLHARQRFTENLFVDFSTSFKNGFAILPGDVIPLDSNVISRLVDTSLLPSDVVSGNTLFFRVLEKEETDRFEQRFKCQIHINTIFDGFGDFDIFFGTDVMKRTANRLPAPVIPSELAERIVVQPDGTVRNFIEAGVTYPGEVSDDGAVVVPTPAPSVDMFAADQSEIIRGADTTIRWATSHAKSLKLSTVDFPVDGSHDVSPTVTRKYFIKAYENDDHTGRSARGVVTVTVVAPPPIIPIDPPVIDSFSADDLNLVLVFGQQAGYTIINWETTNALSARLNGVNVTVNGSRQIEVSETTTFTLVAYETAAYGGREVMRSLTVTVMRLR